MLTKAPPNTPQRKVEFPFHYSPDFKTVHIVVRMADDPGVLASLLSDLRAVVNLIGTTSYSLGEGVAVFSGIGRVLSNRQDAASIREQVSKSRSVLDCQVWESENGLLVDRFHFGVQTANGEEYLLVPARTLSSTYEAFVDTFKSGGETVLFYQGLDYAKARMQVYKSISGSDPRTVFKNLVIILKATGWAVAEPIFEPSGEALRFVNTECFECSVRTKNGRRCTFLRGMAVGAAEAVFGREFTGEETRCKQVGDPVCEFVLKPKDGRPVF
jgi:predicted hydrocarbon binding protein